MSKTYRLYLSLSSWNIGLRQYLSEMTLHWTRLSEQTTFFFFFYFLFLIWYCPAVVDASLVGITREWKRTSSREYIHIVVEQIKREWYLRCMAVSWYEILISQCHQSAVPTAQLHLCNSIHLSRFRPSIERRLTVKLNIDTGLKNQAPYGAGT